MVRIAIPLILACALLPAQTTSTITFNAVGQATPYGAGFTLMATGTGSLTGFGSGQLFAYGTIASISGVIATTPVTTSFTMIFSTGDAMIGQLVLSAGYLLPQLGQTVLPAPTLTITGGTGALAGASGVFPTLTVTATPNGANATLQGTGTGVLLTPASHVTGTLSYTGSFGHFASGGGWDTIITLVNNGTASAQAQVNFYDESGNPSTVPLDFPQGGTAQNASTYMQTMKPGSVLIIDSQGGTNTSVGSAQLFSDGKVSGFLIFRYLPTLQEAAVNLQTQSSSTYTLPFDNTGSIVTGIALSTASTTAAAVQILILDDTGATLATDTITLPGRGHTSFVLGSRYSATNSARGTIQFQTLAGSEIGVVGIRALPTGAYTTIPSIGN